VYQCQTVLINEIDNPAYLRFLEERLGPLRGAFSAGLSLDEILRDLVDFAAMSHWSQLAADERPILAPVRDELTSWAEAHHLREPWCLDTALETALTWPVDYLRQSIYHHLFPTLVKKIVPFGNKGFFPRGLEDPSPFEHLHPAFALELPGWTNPFDEDPLQAQERLEEAIRVALEEHLALRCLSLEKTYGVRPRHRRFRRAHYEWLIRYQCQDESFEEIARSAECSRQAVSAIVHDLTHLLGLRLRPEKRGRPLGARDRGPRSGRRRQDK
jgi:hypothetical protein